MRRVLLAGGVLLGVALLLWRWPDRERAEVTPPPSSVEASSAGTAPQELLSGARREEAPGNGATADRSTTPPIAAWPASIDQRRPRGPAAQLEILVLDAATEAPIAGALVELRGDEGRTLDQQATDPAGRAVVSAARTDDLVVTAEGYAPWMRWLDDGSHGPDGLLARDPGKPRPPIEARLMRPARLHGTVVSSDGEPLASILIRSPDLYLPNVLGKPEATTDEQGRYALAVPPGELFRVELADPEGRIVLREEGYLTLASGEVLQKDFVVGRRSVVHGCATDPAGAPLPALNVCLVSSPVAGPWQRAIPDASETIAQSLTGVDGTFRFEGVLSGRYAVGPGPQPDETDPIAGAVAGHFEGLTVDGTGQDVRRDLVVTRGLWITGVVRQAHGLPASEAWIGGRWAGTGGNVMAASQSDGRFRLGPLAGGLIEIHVHHATGTLDTSVEAGAQDVELVLQAGGMISIAITPPVHATVECASQAEGGSIFRTTGYGRVQFEGLSPGWYDIIVKADDGRFGLAKDVRVESGATAEATVESDPGASIRMSCDGKLAEMQVSIWDGDTWIGTTRLKAGSSWRETVPAGRPVRVHARSVDQAWEQELSVTLGAGEIRELVFPLDE